MYIPTQNLSRELTRNLVLSVLLVVMAGCGGGSDSTSGGGSSPTAGAGSATASDPSLVGTWSLVSDNAIPVPPGTATLVIMANTYSLVSPNCNETGT